MIKSAYFVNSHVNLTLIKVFTSRGFDLITTSPNIEMFSKSHTEVVLWNGILKREAKALCTLAQYNEIIVSSEADWVELLFVHPSVRHILELTERYDKEALLTQLHHKNLNIFLLQSVYKQSDIYLKHAKVCYLLRKYEESEQSAQKLLMVPKKGEEALSLLLVNAVAQNQMKKALQLLNSLAYNSHFKQILDFVLIEKKEGQKKKWLYRAGNDYVSEELIE